MISFVESMALKVINKINCGLRFLCRINRFLSPPLRRLLCNSQVQSHFDYACSAWYSSLRIKSKLQLLQDKCIRFCLNLNNRVHIRQKELKQTNWLPVNDRFKKIISSIIRSLKFCNNTSPLYVNDVFKPTG